MDMNKMDRPRYKIVNVLSTNLTIHNLSRKTLVLWVNSTLHTDIRKVEEMSTGVQYCQLVDLMFPHVLKLTKVKFNVWNEAHRLYNFKILQEVFTFLGITRIIPIENLIKGKFQDNMEFLQWFHHFYEANYPPVKVDASTLRELNPIEIIPKAKEKNERRGGSKHLSEPNYETELLTKIKAIKAERKLYSEKVCQINEICRNDKNNNLARRIRKILADLNDVEED